MTAPDFAIQSAQPAISYTPSTGRDRQALIAECISSILAGRPLPEGLRPHATPVSRPATVAEGIRRILSGRAA
jgi:hypothetical protein